MGRLLADLSSKFYLKTQEGGAAEEGGKGGAPRILVHSTHDTALAGLLNTLDVFDDRCVII